jgi:glycine/D-amino acid oxidase-like deaminating enzyme
MARTDLAVVGGGIIGCMVARAVTERAPGCSVSLFERDAMGSGASRRSAGLHFPRGATDRVRRMAAYSHDYYEALRRRNFALPIHPLSLSLLSTEARAAEVEQSYLDRAALTRTQRLAPQVSNRPPDTAIWKGDGCHRADVAALTMALANDLHSRVTFREGVAVTGIDDAGSGYRLRLSTGEQIIAGSVVLAPGPWLSAPAWRELVAPLEIRVKKVVALHIGQPPPAGAGVIVFHDEDAFLLPLHDRGYWLYSYTCQEWDVDPDRLAAGLSEVELADAAQGLLRWSPALAKAVTGGRVFCDAYSVPREPIISALDGRGSLIFAGAANGSGYRLAPAIAAQAVNLLFPSRDADFPSERHT